VPLGSLAPVAPSSSSLKQLARRLAGPITSPIDGRVADINSRVDHTSERVARIEEAVEAFADSASETSSYLGAEVGRLAASYEALAVSTYELSRPGREAYYRERVATAIDQPLEQLDETTAMLVNHATGHRGPAAQADLWFNSPVNVELSAGAARLTTVNERIVEVPFAMMALSRLPAAASILDVGSAESTFPLSAASLGYRVTAVDPRGLPYSHPNLEVVAGRFEDLPEPQEPYDAVFLISTIEHVGLPAYGITPRGEVTPGAGADRELLESVRERLLAADGVVIITTPYGQEAVDDFERTYGDEALTRLLDGWRQVERRVVTRRDGVTWEPQSETATVDDDGVVMIVATPAST
jgi:2-polyprenyl-3-methyl-5-hydroxy-6-metoxy-1,4-benzoquinol methylase